MKLIILLILTLILVTSCTLQSTMLDSVPCEDCSSSLLKFAECEPICRERFEEVKGTTFFGQEVKEFAGYQKNIQLSNGVKTISCVCKYKWKTSQD